MKCKFCYSSNVIKYGWFKNTQQWWCKDCRRKFADNGAKPNMKTHNDQVSIALGMYYEGVSLNNICRLLQKKFRIYPSASTVYDWIAKYTIAVITEINKYRPRVGDIWLTYDDNLQIFGNIIRFRDVMDARTGYVMVSILAVSNEASDTNRAISLAVQKTGKKPQMIIAEGQESSVKAIFNTAPGTGRSLECIPGHADKLVSGFRDALKVRKKVLCSLKKPGNLDLITEGWMAHYNVFRVQKVLQNRTPSELAGIDEQWEKNWNLTIKHVRKVIDDWRQSVPKIIDIGTTQVQPVEKDYSLVSSKYAG